ncbi:hypothetical protein STEG23_004106, partial [Scotinomys teguina]
KCKLRVRSVIECLFPAFDEVNSLFHHTPVTVVFCQIRQSDHPHSPDKELEAQRRSKSRCTSNLDQSPCHPRENQQVQHIWFYVEVLDPFGVEFYAECFPLPSLVLSRAWMVGFWRIPAGVGSCDNGTRAMTVAVYYCAQTRAMTVAVYYCAQTRAMTVAVYYCAQTRAMTVAVYYCAQTRARIVAVYYCAQTRARIVAVYYCAHLHTGLVSELWSCTYAANALSTELELLSQCSKISE